MNGTSQQCVLITGGAGYIGSHTTIEVIKAGYEVVIIDNLCNSSEGSIRAIEKLTGCESLHFYRVDLRDRSAVRTVFQQHDIKHVLHFAGLKAVGESCKIPLTYYTNNMDCTFSLIEVMNEFSVKSLVFSSSATVYGVPKYLPIDEQHHVGACTNPYGRTKYFIEQLLEDLCRSDKTWSVALLRYFNPAGAHPSGLIGEDPCGPPNNLMPYVAQVAVGRRDKLSIFGDDYDTPDGTGVRDYIHVVDLAIGHVSALQRLQRHDPAHLSEVEHGCYAYNLGTGRGYSVLEMIQQFQKSSGIKLSYIPISSLINFLNYHLVFAKLTSVHHQLIEIETEVVGRREGDVSSCYADASLALRELDWKAEKGLKEMCDDLWRWQSTNPKGFNS